MLNVFRKDMKRLEQKRKGLRSGFTLIELIVVIAVIGIIAAMLVPNYVGVTDKANLVKHINNIETINNQANLWATEKLQPLIGSVDSDGATAADIFGVDGAKLNVTVAGATSDATVPSLGDAANIDNVSVNLNYNYDNIKSDGKTLSLLLPLTSQHPLVMEGYLDKVPENPFKDLEDYYYVIDFKVVKKLVKVPNGSTIQSLKIMPDTKLMKLDDGATADDGIYTLVRNNFVFTYDGADEYVITTDDRGTGINTDTAKIQASTRKDLKIYAADFKTMTSGTSVNEKPLAIRVLGDAPAP